MYIKREIEKTMLEMIKGVKVMLVTGPRQVGKSTTIKHIFGKTHNYITLDDINQLNLALEDPKLFFQNNKLPLIIDEVQYAPNLFIEIKRIVDESNLYGQIILTGSQAFHLMEGITESLAGRVGILEFSGLSFREYTKETIATPFVPTKDFVELERENKENFDLWDFIHKGSLPELYVNNHLNWMNYYGSYVKTYIERDVRNIINIKDLDDFSNFLISIAARTGSLLNYNKVAEEINKDVKTVKSWTKILETTGLICLLESFGNNAIKRMVKTPIIYFLDTGLVSYLLKWNTSDTLKNGAMSGNILESFVVSEIIKSFKNTGYLNIPITFYRDYDQKEIDLIIEADGILYPVEIKKTATPTKTMAKTFSVLNKSLGHSIGDGLILSLVSDKHLLTNNLIAYPIKKI